MFLHVFKASLTSRSIETTRLDNVVDDVYDYYIERFDTGDLVTCRWSDGVKYVERQRVIGIILMYLTGTMHEFFK